MSGWVRDPKRKTLIRFEHKPELKFQSKPKLKMQQEDL